MLLAYNEVSFSLITFHARLVRSPFMLANLSMDKLQRVSSYTATAGKYGIVMLESVLYIFDFVGATHLLFISSCYVCIDCIYFRL